MPERRPELRRRRLSSAFAAMKQRMETEEQEGELFRMSASVRHCLLDTLPYDWVGGAVVAHLHRMPPTD